MSLALKTTMVKDSLALLITQYKNSPNFKAFLTAFLSQVQDIENALWDIFSKTLIDDATDEQLDLLGSIVGIQRDDMGDDEYRLRIKVQILVNKSNGLGDELLRIVNLATGGDCEIDEQYPAALVIKSTEDVDVDGSVIAEILNKAKTAGVRCVYEWYTTSTPFVFDGGDGLGFTEGEFANAETGE